VRAPPSRGSRHVQDLTDRDGGAATADDLVRHLAQQPGEAVGRVVEPRGAPDQAHHVQDRREHRRDLIRLGFIKLPAGLIEVLKELEIVDGLDGAFEDGDGELLERREVPDERGTQTSSEVIRGPIRA